MAQVEFDDDALADLDGVYDHIGRSLKSPQAADRTIDRIQTACERYATQPGMGEPRPDLGPDVRILPWDLTLLSIDLSMEASAC
jgi:toxin ParE1/3/4